MKSPEELNPADQELQPTIEAIIENPNLLPQEQKERAEFGVRKLEVYDKLDKLFKESLAARGVQYNPFDPGIWEEFQRFINSDEEDLEVRNDFKQYLSNSPDPKIKPLAVRDFEAKYLDDNIDEGYFLHEISLAGIELAEQAGLVMADEVNVFKDYCMPVYRKVSTGGNIYARINRIKASDKISQIPEER